MPSNVRVAVRVRPLLPNEVAQGHQQQFMDVNTINNQISISGDGSDDQNKQTRKNFKFDKIIDSQYTQEEVFNQLQVKGLVNKVMEGFHATIFAYGQTGSGKTYTMEGYKYEEAKMNERAGKPIISEDQNNGLTIRAIREAFRQAESMKKEKYVTISCSFLQIYNEKVFDLLNTEQFKKNKDGQGLRIRWNKNEQFTVENLYIFKCDSVDYCLSLYNKGIKNKIVASHNLNHASSRSHAMFSLIIDIVDHAQVDNIVQSKLQLVDLAGSERSSVTGTTGIAQKESIDINKSLFTLRKVITSLAESSKSKNASIQNQHIPYRDSKLTCLLKQSLGGNSYCLMIACLSPSDAYIEENISTLNYATKASYISNEPTKNEDPKIKLINELKSKVISLQRELSQANNHIQFLSNLTGQPVPENMGQNTSYIADVADNPNKMVDNPLNSQNQIEQAKPMQESQQEMQQLKTKFPQNIQTPQQKLQQYSQEDEAFRKFDHQQLSQKLIESVAMVKELMQSNKVLRDTIDAITENNDRNESDIFQLQTENRDLRDRIEILEAVIGSTTQKSEFDQLDWRELLEEEKTPTLKTNNIAVNELANELIETKKENRKLREEMDQMRQQMQDMSFEQQQYRNTQMQMMYQQQQQQQLVQQQMYGQQQLVNIYGGKDATPPQKRSQSNGFKAGVGGQPKNKQDALKMLNEMMNKRVNQRQSNNYR